MVALQHGAVVVQHGQRAAHVAQEGVGPPWVVQVMDGGCDEGGDFVQRIQRLLKARELLETARHPEQGPCAVRFLPLLYTESSSGSEKRKRLVEQTQLPSQLKVVPACFLGNIPDLLTQLRT